MKKWITGAVGALLCLTLSNAFATTIVKNGSGQLAGFKSVVIGGVAYNAYLSNLETDARPRLFTDLPGALDASQALADLFAEGGILDDSVYDTANGMILGCENVVAPDNCFLLTAYQDSIVANAVDVAYLWIDYNLSPGANESVADFEGVPLVVGANNDSNYDDATWVRWERVPAPATLSLLVLGALAFGSLRVRRV